MSFFKACVWLGWGDYFGWFLVFVVVVLVVFFGEGAGFVPWFEL